MGEKKSDLVIVPVEPVDGFYDEIEIEDMEYNEDERTFYYPCPCGDRFQITVEELEEGEDVGRCPSCTLTIRVIYSADFFEEDDEDDDDDE